VGLQHPPPSFQSFKRLVLSHPHSPLAKFDGPEDDGVRGVFHETTEENKGKEFALGGFTSPPPMGVEDVEVSLLHMIFDLKGVLVGKEYFSKLITFYLHCLTWFMVLPY